jgi:plasmid stabilization system protein ParE
VARVVWSPAALRDLGRLRAFLAPKNPDAARRAARAIKKGAEPLAAHPEIGRPVENMPVEYRDWFIPFGDGGYVMRYRLEPNRVVVVAIRHGREVGF